MLKCKFEYGATDVKSIPNFNIPEVALAGRSNVGKSSFINKLANCRVARVSSTPGCTQQINFYPTLNGLFTIVDLPGYGYSKAGKKKSNQYLTLVEYYLLNRKNLKKVIVFLDIRRGFTELDFDFVYWLNLNKIKFICVLTKSDKLNPNELKKALIEVQNQALEKKILPEKIIAISNRTNQGIKELIYEITKYEKKI